MENSVVANCFTSVYEHFHGVNAHNFPSIKGQCKNGWAFFNGPGRPVTFHRNYTFLGYSSEQKFLVSPFQSMIAARNAR